MVVILAGGGWCGKEARLLRLGEELGMLAKQRYMGGGFHVPKAFRKGAFVLEDAHIIDKPIRNGFRDMEINVVRQEARNAAKQSTEAFGGRGRVANFQQNFLTGPNSHFARAKNDFDFSMGKLEQNRKNLENLYIRGKVGEANPGRAKGPQENFYEFNPQNLAKKGPKEQAPQPQAKAGEVKAGEAKPGETKDGYMRLEDYLQENPNSFLEMQLERGQLNPDHLVKVPRLNGGVGEVQGARNAGKTDLGFTVRTAETKPQDTSVVVRDQGNVPVVKDAKTSLINVGEQNTSLAKIGEQNTSLAKVGEKNTSLAKVGEQNTALAKVGEQKMTQPAKIETKSNLPAKIGDQTTALVNMANKNTALALKKDTLTSIALPQGTTDLAVYRKPGELVSQSLKKSLMLDLPPSKRGLTDLNTRVAGLGYNPMFPMYGQPVNLDAIKATILGQGADKSLIEGGAKAGIVVDPEHKPISGGSTPITPQFKSALSAFRYPINSPMFMMLSHPAMKDYFKAIKDVEKQKVQPGLKTEFGVGSKVQDQKSLLETIGVSDQPVRDVVSSNVANQALKESLEKNSSLMRLSPTTLSNYNFLAFNAFSRNPALYMSALKTGQSGMESKPSAAEVDAIMTRRMKDPAQLVGYKNYLDLVSDPAAILKTDLLLGFGLDINPLAARPVTASKLGSDPTARPFISQDFSYGKRTETDFYEKLAPFGQHFRDAGLDEEEVVEDVEEVYHFFKNLYFISRPMIQYFEKKLGDLVTFAIHPDDENKLIAHFPNHYQLVVNIADDDYSDQEEASALLTADDKQNMLIDLVFYNLILDVEALCMEQFEITECEKTVSGLIEVGNKINSVDKRQFGKIGDLIRAKLTEMKLEKVLKFLEEQDTFNDFLRKAQVFNNRLEYLLLKFKLTAERF